MPVPESVWGMCMLTAHVTYPNLALCPACGRMWPRTAGGRTGGRAAGHCITFFYKNGIFAASEQDAKHKHALLRRHLRPGTTLPSGPARTQSPPDAHVRLVGQAVLAPVWHAAGAPLCQWRRSFCFSCPLSRRGITRLCITRCPPTHHVGTSHHAVWPLPTPSCRRRRPSQPRCPIYGGGCPPP